MKNIFRVRVSNFHSAIQKRPRRPKWVELVAVVVAFVICAATADAQQQGKLPKLGWLAANSSTVRPENSNSLMRELDKFGYVDR